MSWKRSCFEKAKQKDKIIKYLKEKGYSSDAIHFISPNADNRHYCWGCGKEKYCYETKEKAARAVRFSPNKQRVYYCELCSCWHTTKELSVSDIRYLNNGFITIDTSQIV